MRKELSSKKEENGNIIFCYRPIKLGNVVLIITAFIPFYIVLSLFGINILTGAGIICSFISIIMSGSLVLLIRDKINKSIENKIIIPKMNKKKLSNYYNSIKFKIEVLNVLINSKVFERINLNINIFEDNPIDDITISDILISNFTKINKINSFEEFKKNMNDHKINEINDVDEDLLSFEGLNIADKCIICEEEFNNKNKNIKKDEINILSESSEGINEDNKDNNKEYIVKCKVCKCPFHMICLANYELNKNNDIFNLVPKKADCFVCGKSLIWSEWVKDFTDQYKK